MAFFVLSLVQFPLQQVHSGSLVLQMVRCMVVVTQCTDYGKIVQVRGPKESNFIAPSCTMSINCIISTLLWYCLTVEQFLIKVCILSIANSVSNGANPKTEQVPGLAWRTGSCNRWFSDSGPIKPLLQSSRSKHCTTEIGIFCKSDYQHFLGGHFSWSSIYPQKYNLQIFSIRYVNPKKPQL